MAADTINATQAQIFASIGGTAFDTDVTQVQVFAAAAEPSDTVNVSQVQVFAIESSNGHKLDVSQVQVFALVRGAVSDPKVRAWTFTLDGHDFYILRLGNKETLVYDLTTEQWYSWGTGSNALWQAYTGINWTGGNRVATVAGSNIVVGSDANGSIWFLDPDRDRDGGLFPESVPAPFLRRVTGQVLSKGYSSYRVNQVQLLGSIGSLTEPDFNTITLSYSDDRGHTYVNAGTVTVPAEAYEARVDWRSLGSFRQPGRLFRLEDFGALRRVDSLTMTTDMTDAP